MVAGTHGSTDARAAQGVREERLSALYARWEQFSKEYATARERNDQEVMTNLRGLMLVIKRQINKLGGQLPSFPYPEAPHLADL
ncbi:MAG: hypothetical protein AVDCRST_MAG77-477 [uncultured Chloroflexi bacterium]|uniref:Uncharacterized protein n=1 Tax=uncultured Chloroflexota bacterium TaxID=166587 RepID=A0A6J4HEU8_9CHLR|nr:MAG: hypothetical protein AVDCRST_MAG77-477 [uncultured Chloroflexota bacterium]